MRSDLPNIIVKNVLTDLEISEVLKVLSETKHKTFVKHLCHTSWHVRLPKEIEDKFLYYAEEISKTKLRLLEYNISKYENVEEDGKKYYPLLWPHTDEAFGGPRVTLDYQLRSNISWPIEVDNEDSITNYTLSDNQLLSFSGTHQVHWRPKKDFSDNDFIEMIFLHFEPIGAKPLNLDHIKKMRKKSGERFEEWKNTEGHFSNDSNPENDYYRYWYDDPKLIEKWSNNG